MEPALGEDIIDAEMDQAKRAQMINVIIIGVVVAFLCLLAVVVSCVQRHSNRVDENLDRQGEINYDKLKGQQQEGTIKQGAKHNIGTMLGKAVSRKYIAFNGVEKSTMSPATKYGEQAVPILEDSQE